MKTILPADSTCQAVHARTIDGEMQSFRESLLRSLAEHQVVAIEGDDNSLAAFMTGIVAEKTVTQCQWATHSMGESETATLWLLMLVLADEICKRLGISNEQVATYAAMFVFRHNHGYLFGSLQKEMQRRYREMTRSRTSQLTINQLHAYIHTWLYRDNFASNRELARITALLTVSCRRVYKVISEQVISVDTRTDNLRWTDQAS